MKARIIFAALWLIVACIYSCADLMRRGLGADLGVLLSAVWLGFIADCAADDLRRKRNGGAK